MTKYATLALMAAALAVGSAIAQGPAPAKGEPEMKTVEQKFAYVVGLSVGRNMKDMGLELDADLILKGLKDALADKSALTEEQLSEVQKEFKLAMATKQAAKVAAAKAAAKSDAEKNLKEGEDFLAANKTKEGVKVLASGVQYKVLKSGTGKTPKLTDVVLANYRGTLVNGTEFDTNANRDGGAPAEFPVNGVIPGWTEVLQLMKVGDKWQVFIPTNRAYGMNPHPGGKVRPNDALIFEMELVDIK